MKHLLLLLCSLLWGSLALAQQHAVVKGKISAPAEDSVSLSRYTNLVTFTQQRQTVRLGPSGTFQFTVPIEEPGLVFLQHAGSTIELFLHPGDKLELSYDTRKVDESIRFKGNAAIENNCLAKLNLNYTDDEDFHYTDLNIYTNEAAYLKLVDEKFKTQREFTNHYLKKQRVSESFRQWLDAEIRYEAGVQKMNYPKIRAAAVKLEDPYRLSAFYYAFTQALPANQADKLNNQCYLDYLQDLMELHYRKSNADRQDPGYYKGFYEQAKKMLQGKEMAIVAGRILMESMQQAPIGTTEAILNDYRKLPEAAPYLPELQAAFDYHKPLAKGSPAPDLHLRNAKGNPVTLNELKGKKVYLYFYAKKCGSCHLDIPYAAKLAEEFEDDNLAFVFVSVDKDSESWKKAVAKKPWPGTNAHTTDSAAVVKAYRLDTYPAALLLDEKGRIYSNSVKRPSSDELKPALLQLLGKPADEDSPEHPEN